jgi:hypothetical protein
MLHHGLLVLAALAVVFGAWAGIRGVRLLADGLRHGDDPSGPPWVVRGLRGIILAICMAALAAGTVFGQFWLVVFRALWLAEEVYETGVLALILRSGARQETETTPGGRGEATYSPMVTPTMHTLLLRGEESTEEQRECSGIVAPPR